MKIPMVVQADVLQITLPASAVDNSVWINAGAVLLGVLVAFALSVFDKKREQEYKKREDLLRGYNYLGSYLTANKVILLNQMSVTTIVAKTLFDDQLARSYGASTFQPVDYVQLGPVLAVWPDLLTDIAAKVNAINSLEYIRGMYVALTEKKSGDDLEVSAALASLLYELNISLEAWCELEERYLDKNKIEPLISPSRSFIKKLFYIQSSLADDIYEPKRAKKEVVDRIKNEAMEISNKLVDRLNAKAEAQQMYNEFERKYGSGHEQDSEHAH